MRDVAAAYRLEEVLSASPLSTVRRAVDPGSGQIVAVKLLKPLGMPVTQRQRERFETVMRRLAELQLAAMPEILDFGFTAEDEAFLVTSFVDGTPLCELLGSPVERVVPILADLARALEVLADAGLVHHNLCPENVLVVESPGGETVQVLGLGTVAYLAAEGGEAPLGRSPEAERFAAPELLAPRGLTDALAWRADLYSFALLTSELLHAEISGMGSPAPRVTFPASTRRHATALQEQLSIALRREPGARLATFAELRRLLLSRIAPDASGTTSQTAADERAEVDATVRQEVPAAAARPVGRPQIKVKVGKRGTPHDEEPTIHLPRPPVADAAPAAPPAPAFDPNKTDPALVVPEVPPVVTETARTSREAVQVVASDSVVADVVPVRLAEEPVTAAPRADAPASEGARVPREPAAATEPSSTKVPPKAPPPVSRAATTARPRARWKVAALVVAGLLVVVGIAVVATVLLDPGAVPLIVVPTPIPPTPVPLPTAAVEPDGDPQLLAARDAMEDGDFDTARRIMAEIPAERLASLGARDAALARSIAAELEGMSRERAIADLGHGLRSGNMRTLRAAVDALAGLSAREQAAVPGLKEQLATANNALRVAAQIARAQRSGDALELLQRSAEMIAILPAYRRAFELREEAVRTLLAEADGHAQGRRWERAIQRLELLARAWPEAPGVAERLARVRHDQAADEQARRALAQAQAALEGGNPEAGLAALASLAPPPHLASAFTEAREQLQARLADLDAQPPTITIPGSFEPRFKKNEILSIPVHIIDDYRVASAKAYVRREGQTQYREVQLKHPGGEQYLLELSPAVHGNASVELYIVATDSSGHSSSLGTASKPYEVKRRRLFGR